MFLIGAIGATQIEDGMRASPWWIPMLLLLLFAVPVTMYLTVRFSSWEEFWSFLGRGAGNTKMRIISALHGHSHPKLHAKGQA